MNVPNLATGRRTRQLVMAATIAAVIAAAVLTRRDSRPASRFQPAHEALCRARALASDGDLTAARRRFVDDAHAQLHELATALPADRRAVVADLLEAKGAVELGFAAAEVDGMPADLDHLTRATRSAIAATGDRPPTPCPENP